MKWLLLIGMVWVFIPEKVWTEQCYGREAECLQKLGEDYNEKNPYCREINIKAVVTAEGTEITIECAKTEV